MNLLLNQKIKVEYIFVVTSMDECQQAKQLIDVFKIDKYQLSPLYTEENINFFEEYVFLSKEDILSSTISIKDIYI